MNILAIIPARGGSKGIPRKNIKILAGQPLIAHTIKAAQGSKYIDRIIVSTDDLEIGRISEQHGAEFIKRPKEYALDDSPTIEAVEHSLNVLEDQDYNTDVIVLLQATSPLRDSEDIDKALEIFFNNDCEAVASVCVNPYKKIIKMENKYLEIIVPPAEDLNKSRQELPSLYSTNGAITVIGPNTLLKYESFLPPHTMPYQMPLDRSIDIDTEIEFYLAGLLIENPRK